MTAGREMKTCLRRRRSEYDESILSMLDFPSHSAARYEKCVGTAHLV